MNPKVLIVEDKVIVAQDIKDILVSIGCLVTDIVSSGESAIESFNRNRPEIILMDIRLKGNMNGIEASKKIQTLGEVIIIYLTAHSDPKILQSAFETQPVNFIVKPFSAQDLQIAIGLAESRLKNQIIGSHILLRHQGILEKIPLQQILFAKADGSYTIIETTEKSLIASFNLAHFIQLVDSANFVRVHRSYIVHMKHVDSFSTNKLFIGSNTIPISRSFKNEVLDRFRSK